MEKVRVLKKKSVKVRNVVVAQTSCCRGSI